MVNTLLAQGGLRRDELSPDEVRARVPQLTGPLTGGFVTTSDSTGDIHKFTTGLADWLAGQGVRFRMGAEITDVAAHDDGVTVTAGEPERFDGVVVCAGVGSRAIAAKLGDRVNIYPVKGYSITVNLRDAASRAAAPHISLLDDKAKIVTSRLGEDRFRVAGTAEFNGYNRDIRSIGSSGCFRAYRPSIACHGPACGR